MADDSGFVFALFSDTHIRGDDDRGPFHYPSVAAANGRIRHAVCAINECDPAFAIHLGDIQHPIPAIPAYEPAIETATELLGQLHCRLHVVPGNHDVGDKPGTFAGASEIEEQYLKAWDQHWGPSYGSFDHADCHFVLINASLMNSDLSLEAAQQKWLLDDLATARRTDRRIFVFSHYPVYLTDPQENSHYDNIAEPARGRLLDLLEQHGVEAVFAAHIHHWFYHRHAATRMYTVPSVTFVRPDPSELFATEPADEYGRNDTPKLGFVAVRIHPRGHTVEFIRTNGLQHDPDDGTAPPGPLWLGHEPDPSPAANLGVHLRYAWAQTIEMPYANLDEFSRKPVRNDYPLLAVADAGIRRVRIPLADLTNPATLQRIAALVDDDYRFTVFSAGVPHSGTHDIIREHHGLIDQWEVLSPWHLMDRTCESLRRLKSDPDLSISLSKIEALAELEARGRADRFSHFVRHGFEIDDEDLLRQLTDEHHAEELIDRVVFRISPDLAPFDAIVRAAGLARSLDRRATCHVQMQGPRHSVLHGDDLAIAGRVAETLLAAVAMPETRIFLDTLVDHDRGYYPRHGLIDRRGNPRSAWHVLRHLKSILPATGTVGITATSSSPKVRSFLISNPDPLAAALIPQSAAPGDSVTLAMPPTIAAPTAARWIDLLTRNAHDIAMRLTRRGNQQELNLTAPSRPWFPALVLFDP